MRPTQWQKILRDVFSRKTRTAMVSTSIFIGVLGVVTLVTMGDLIIQRLNEEIDPDEMAMVYSWISLDDSLPGLDRRAVDETLRQYPEVTVVESSFIDSLFWREPDQSGFIEGLVQAFSVPDGVRQTEPVEVIAGHFPVTGQRELAVERRMADRYGLAVGDPLVVRVLGALVGNPLAAGAVPEETWTVSGIIYAPYEVGNDTNNRLYATYDDFLTLAGLPGGQSLRVRFSSFAQADAAFEDFDDYIERETPYQVGWYWLDDPANNDIIREAHDWINTLTALAMIAMLVSSFLVMTVIITIVIEQRRQIGVMKSLGATRWNNFVTYAAIAIIYGLIGTLPGVLVGIPAGYYLTQPVASLFNILTGGFAVSVTAVATGAAMGILMPFVVAIVPVLQGTRVTIREAITDLGISSQYGQGAVSRLLGRLPAPASARQALANVYQKRFRLALIGLTLTLAVGSFMGVSGLFMSFNEVIDSLYDTYNYHLGVQPISPDRYDYEAVRRLMADNVSGLAAIYPVFDMRVDVEETYPDGGVQTTDLSVSGIDPRQDSVLLDLETGHAWQDDPDREGIVLTRGIAKTLHRRVGDTLTLVYEGRRLTVEVIGIDRFPFDRGFMPWQAVAGLAGESTPDEYWLRFADEEIDSAGVERRAGEIRELLLQHGIIADFYNQRSESEADAKAVLTAGLIFNIASAVMAAVGAIGLLAMLFISVFERQREIGIMRSIGAGSTTIAAQFLIEGLLVGGVAWLLGVPLSYGLAMVLHDLLPIGQYFEFTYPPIALVIGLVGMVVVATLASLWPSLAAVRKTVSDILRYQ